MLIPTIYRFMTRDKIMTIALRTEDVAVRDNIVLRMSGLYRTVHTVTCTFSAYGKFNA